MVLDKLKQHIVAAARPVVGETIATERFEVMFSPEAVFGDVATNLAMVYAKELRIPPRELAQRLMGPLGQLPGMARAEVAGPGFINLTLTDEALANLVGDGLKHRPQVFAGQKVVTEYSDPNPFKALHAGHLYTTIVGDVISRLFEVGGGTVHRLNYGGDVGLHVGKAMWGIVRHLGGEHPERLAEVRPEERSVWISQRYVEGNTAYEGDAQAREEIIACNKRAYALHESGDHESPFAKIYWTCREWSYDGFRKLYDRLEITPFERYVAESEVAPLAQEIVKRGLEDGVFDRSEDAVVFNGESEGLHTRVFLTAAGLPTYEAKDLSLAALKWRDYRFDRSVIITGNDIVEYMKVVLAALAHFYPEVVPRSLHLTHGMVKLPGGVKMSSRHGNTLWATDILDAAAAASQTAGGSGDWQVVVGAVKYAFLKQRVSGDIIYDPEESVSLEGNSGPYLQYAHARARSILAKAHEAGGGQGDRAMPRILEPAERLLARKMIEYAEVMDRAVRELAPHGIATYLYELAQVFNRFYEGNRVMGHERESERIWLVSQYADILKDGLGVLGIASPHQL